MRRRTFALTVLALLLVTACATEEDGGATTAAGDDGGASTTAGEPAGDGVRAADSDLGAVLVDPDGFTLYVFTADTGGESTCYDSCAQTWPPVPGDTAISGDLDASLFGTTERTDGTDQLTVAGQPLYRYTPDAEPGDVNGQGVGGVWFVVGPDGAMIGNAEARADY